MIIVAQPRGVGLPRIGSARFGRLAHLRSSRGQLAGRLTAAVGRELGVQTNLGTSGVNSQGRSARRTPRRTRLPCCACAASGHAAAPPRAAMNSRRLISSIGVLRTELSKLGRSQPLCARLKGYHPEGAADRLLHCGISVASAARFMAEMGHKNRISVLLSPAFMSETAPIPTEFCAMQRKSSSAINRHNQQLFDDLVSAQPNR